MDLIRDRLARREEQSRSRLKANRAGAVLRREWNDLMRFLRLREIDTDDSTESVGDSEQSNAADRLITLRAFLASRDDGDPVPAEVVRLIVGAMLGMNVDAPEPAPAKQARVAAAKSWIAGRMTNGSPDDPATLRDVRAIAVLLGSLAS